MAEAQKRNLVAVVFYLLRLPSYLDVSLHDAFSGLHGVR